MTRRGRQTELGGALEALARRLDRSGGESRMQVACALAWEKVAGQRVQAHTTSAHLRQGELVVGVDSPAWATQLTAMAGPYAEAINEELGKSLVKSVRFTVSKRAREEIGRRLVEEDAPAAPPKPESVALTADELRQVEESAAVIPDDALREAAIRATVADLEWKKGIAAARSREEAAHGLRGASEDQLP